MELGTIIGAIISLVVLLFVWAVIYDKTEDMKASARGRRFTAESNRKNALAKERNAKLDEFKTRPLESFALESDPTPQDEPDEPPDGVLVGVDTDTNQPLAISEQLRGKHLYLIGKTRTGKTTLIKNLIVQDIENGHGVCAIDPHGDMAEDLLSNVPEERIKDVIYFDPTKEWCPAFNIFRLPYPAFKLTEDIISCFKLFFDSWGPRMEHILRYSCLTMLSSKYPVTLFDLRRMLIDENHRLREHPRSRRVIY